MEEYHIRYNKHLNAQYIPDAHGLPLLTDAHLGHANDLSDWIIEPSAKESTSCRPRITAGGRRAIPRTGHSVGGRVQALTCLVNGQLRSARGQEGSDVGWRVSCLGHRSGPA